MFAFKGQQARVTAVRDLTERRKTEEALRDTKAMLQAAIDSSQAAIAIADAPSGKLRYVNKAGLSIRGGTEEELVKDVDINKYVASWQILHFDGTEYKTEEVPLARAILYGKTCSAEFILRRTDGEDRIVWANAAPIHDTEGNVKYGIVVFLDITERKQAEQERENLVKKLKKALDEIKTLRGILPICSFCKKIRDDRGYWEQVDVYIYKYSEADISHSICPECMKEHYPVEYEEIESDKSVE